MWCLCHKTGMDSEIDLNTADRNVLIGIISQQQAIIEGLEKRVARLEGNAKPDASRRMPGLKPKTGRKPARPKGSRKPRRHGFARTRMTPHPAGGACDGTVSRLRNPVVRWLDPAHSGSDRPASGSGAGNGARLHRPYLSPLPALLCAADGTGRHSAGPAAAGDQI